MTSVPGRAGHLTGSPGTARAAYRPAAPRLRKTPPQPDAGGAMRKNAGAGVAMPKNDPPLFVTRSSVPDDGVFLQYVREALETRRLTNQGPHLSALRKELERYLGLSHLTLCANGTLALMLALRLSGLSGKKVVTTPFTYVATLTALLWEGCTPVFADIDPETLCLSPDAVEKTIRTHADAAGILPVHVYGNACAVAELDEVCARHGLLSVYDAAHAFGSRLHGRSLLDYGNCAICSFHATKLFHTIEGGCLVTHSQAEQDRAGLLHAFGHVNDDYYLPGINAKMSEIHAAMGRAVLPHVTEYIQARRALSLLYDDLLDIPANPRIRRPALAGGLEYNHAYYPILLESEAALHRVMKDLEAENIHPRRYFYPSLTTLPYLPAVTASCSCPVADDVAPRALCLPLYPELEKERMEKIAAIVRRGLKE